MNKLIKTPEDHAEALKRLDDLMAHNPAAGTDECFELELLAHLVEEYEQRHFDLGVPSPVEAILFRMEQQGLKAKDLVPYLGSRSKVSEVLNGKRSLTLAMIRKLHSGLGIPLGVLIGGKEDPLPEIIPAERFPLKEMFDRGWFDWFTGTWRQAREQGEELLQRFFNNHFNLQEIPALHRQKVRSGSKEDLYALHAWKTRVIRMTSNRQIKAPFDAAAINETFINNLRTLSLYEEGPKLAISLLEKYGIAVVIEAHLKGTHLDGAALRMTGGGPVIALTLRYDRLDHFWFCLFHELCHVTQHLFDDEADAFFDNLDDAGDRAEVEADQYAMDALIPRLEWARIRKEPKPTVRFICDEARRLVVHPSILAGRIRREEQNYSLFTQLIGQGEVRRLFPEWKK
jgi:HTH-type transcriptional regulator/antitoxin HigA